MSLYTWGTNKYGQLATEDTVDKVDPVVVEAFKGRVIVQTSAGEYHGLAVAADGSVYAFGRGTEGCMGNGTRVQNNPTPIPVTALRHEFVVQANCGYYHCLAVTSNGRVYQWGKINRIASSDEASGYFGMAIQLPGMDMDVITESHKQYYAGDLSSEDGQDDFKDISNFGAFVSYLQPTPILVGGPLLQVKVTHVAAGYAFSLACTDQGELYGWGFNDKGQLGIGHRINREAPQKITALKDKRVIAIACGQQHSLAVTDNGEVYGWGLNVFGQLGLGDTRDRLVPAHLTALKDHFVTSVACGSEHSIALTDQGQVFTWGSSEYGQQGSAVGNFEDWGTGNRASKTQSQQQAFPHLLDAFQDKFVVQIACGYLHNVALTKEGEVLTWGWGINGQLGHGNRRYQLIPRHVQAIGEEIVSIAAGSKHSMAINAGSTTTFAFDFKQLVNNPLYSDIEFVVEGKTLYAHKVILAARCPRLAAELYFNERNLGVSPKVIRIKDARYHPFLAFLHYLYTDHVGSKTHLFKDLIALSNKYKVPRLKALCEFLTSRKESHLNKMPPSSFSKDMRHVISMGLYSDITCFLEEEQIYVKAHRAILASRCDYFKTIFECSFKEQGKDRLDFSSFDRQSFESVLEFIYTGETDMNADNVVDILTAADRLLLDDLKAKCEVMLAESLDEENCNYLMEASERFSAPRLKRICSEWKARMERVGA